MKHLTLLTLLLLFALGFTSCSKDEEEVLYDNIPVLQVPPGLVDGGRISGISLYCLEKDGKPYGIWYNYYPKTKTIKDYSNIRLCLMIDVNTPLRKTDDEDEMLSIERLESNYFIDKMAYALGFNEINDSALSVMWRMNGMMTAYVNGEVTLTCDKTLFGEQPGTNLSKHFFLLPGCRYLPIGIEKPEMLYGYEDELPSLMSERFPDGAWIQHEYRMELKSLPEEKYEELTLHLSIPMTIEHVRDYMMSNYIGDSFGPRYTEQTFEADCLIKFKWD